MTTNEEIEMWKRRYYDVADAVCRESSGPEDLCRQARRTREERDSWKDCAIKLERERDEAREAAARWEASFEAMECAGAEQAQRADANREWALRAERERNEAREDLEFRRELYALQTERLKRIERERDEAREAIIATLEANRHLADGNVCTLAKLKSVVPDWE